MKINTIKVIGAIDENSYNQAIQVYQNQIAAFGGITEENELTEMFKRDGYVCVRFRNGNWYHYDLTKGTWW